MLVKQYSEVVAQVQDLGARDIYASRSEILFRVPTNQTDKLLARLKQFGPTHIRTVNPQETTVSVLY